MTEVDGKIEAILFASGDYVTAEKLSALTEAKPADIKKAIDRIKEKYANSAIDVLAQGEAWKFHVKDDYMPMVQNIIQNTELTKSVMETLAVIAWKAPIMQSEVIKIRTNKAYEHIDELAEKQFLTKEKSGRSYLLKLTPKFYEYFDIGSKEEIKQIFEGVQDQPKGQQVLTGEKVIDFDGTPRSSAKLSEGEASKLEVYDLEEEKRLEKERKHDQAMHIKSMKGDHESYLEKLDNLLDERATERNTIVEEIHEQIPSENVEEEKQEQVLEETGPVVDEAPEYQPPVEEEPEEMPPLPVQDPIETSIQPPEIETAPEENIDVPNPETEMEELEKEVEEENQEDDKLIDEVIEDAEAWGDVEDSKPKQEIGQKSSSLEEELDDPYYEADEDNEKMDPHEESDPEEAAEDADILDEVSGEKSER